ncbi:hypothetical protein MRX96_021454 [Rhipicephalus microplus]
MAGCSVEIDNTSAKRQKRSVDSPVTTLMTATTLPSHLQGKSCRTGQNPGRLHKTDHQQTQKARLSPTIYADNPQDPKEHQFVWPTLTDFIRVEQPRKVDCCQLAFTCSLCVSPSKKECKVEVASSGF